MKTFFALCLLLLFSNATRADVFFTQPPDAGGGLIPSSWADPEGSDADYYAYDSFITTANVPVSEVRWRGGYIHNAMYSAHAWRFTITFYESIAGGWQPHLTNPQLPEFYLAKYTIDGNAGETPAGTFGGIQMYDYSCTLPTPFQATAGVKYWLRIEASQIGQPDWGIAKATGGDGYCFMFSTGMARFYYGTGDTSFTLLAPPGPYFTASTHSSPDFGGSTSGDGVFTDGSSVTVHALANPGYAFVNWTLSGTQASTAANYNFTIHSDRQLVANFVPAFGITTSASPPSGGTTSGDGSYPYGTSVTVSATAKPSYQFVNWTENGVPVSVARNYTFHSSADRVLTANFVPSGTNAVSIVSRPHDNSGTIIKSAWYPPDGLDGDQYVYDSFSTAANQTITEVHWRGGYTNYKSGAGKAPAYNFTVSIHPSIAAGTQPDMLAAPLVRYSVGGNAGETAAGTFGGTAMYDYQFVLPTAFNAVGGTTYWLQIEASQGLTPTYYWPPDWGFAVGTGGDAHHFQKITGGPTGTYTGDAAFSLLGLGSGFSINPIASPDAGGVVGGGGVFASGANTTLTATPAPGYVFVNWNENGAPVSTATSYPIIVSGNRTLVANFAQQFAIATSVQPTGGGTATGGGTFLSGADVVVTATANAGFLFVNWTEDGWEVSTSPKYYFLADANHSLVANFVPVCTITTSVSPSGSGSVAGGGNFINGTSVTVVPTPSAGYAFVNWTEGGVPVCNSPSYTFTAIGNRSLVAHFAPSCAITATTSSTNGLATGGICPSGGSALALAVPSSGYAFVNWTENGVPVSTAAGYTFTAATNRALVANFTPDLTSVTFDFDTGAPSLTTGQAAPFGQTAAGLTATFTSASGPAFSVQNDTSLGWSMPGFSGNYLYPDVSGGTLEIRFSQPLCSIALTFATPDFQQIVIPSSVQLTAYQDATPVGTVTATGNYNAGDTMPMGTIGLSAAQPFNRVALQSAAGILVDNITVASIPSLNLVSTGAGQMTLTWPGPAWGWELQENLDLDPAHWVASNRTVSVAGGLSQVTVTPAANSTLFFRLRHQ